MSGDRVALRLSTRAELNPACRSSMSSFRKCRALDLKSEGKDTGQLIEGKNAVGALISWRVIKECLQEGQTLRKQN